ncbi:MAG: HTTM domain-containing protein [Polyangiaceae bacterium]
MVVQRLTQALNRPVDAASVAVFRIAFGVLMVCSTLRFFAHGWVHEFYQRPTHFFSYWGLGWVRPLPGTGMYWVYGGLALAACFIALGAAYRVAACVFAVGFNYAHFCDRTNYLNHYYLVGVLAGLLLVLPLDRLLSWRVIRQPEQRCDQVRGWVLYLLRFQVGLVYVFGGIGKLGADWLTRAEPLRIWLSADTELPLLGRLLVQPWASLALSWCGALFDLSIVPLLCFRATRAPAFVVLVAFHVLTALLFPIGMFPWIMIVAATVFLSPSWPRAWFGRLRHPEPRTISGSVAGAPLAAPGRVLAAAHVAFQLILPLRSALYPGNTLWSEEGFRFSWKVMLIEKQGSLEYRVVDQRGRTFTVLPKHYLTPLQRRMASTQPDMILELSHIIARDFAARGYGSVRVYADSEVSFNGRLHARLIDPETDLAAVADSLAPKPWILPAPKEAPSF